MAHIEKRGSRWRVRYRDPGGSERSRTFERKIDAARFKSTTEAALVKGDWIDPNLGKVTVKEWGRTWYETTVDLRRSSRA